MHTRQTAQRSVHACEFRHKVRRLFAATLLAAVCAATTPPAVAAQPGAPAEMQAEDEHHGGVLYALKSAAWPAANFVILVGILYYFLKAPLSAHLVDRKTTIRKDLVDAAELSAAANRQLAEIDAKVKALPGEIDTLRRRGAEEIAAEERRIAELAAAERERLLEQTRREIELQLRIAKRDLLEHAADLAVGLASDRIQKEITPADHQRLVERYLNQLDKA